MKKGAVKKFFRKFWYLLWKDDSLKGWLFAIVFLFVFIKFIFFPLLSLATGTALPLAIVESCSMHHKNTVFSNFENWWERHDDKYTEFEIEKQDFRAGFLSKFRRGFTKGDILFITGVKAENIELGDIILFSSGTKKNPVIHRVINIKQENNEYIFKTIGDNNGKILTPSNNAANVDEREITESQIVGKARFRIVPYAGWLKLIFFEHLQPSENKGICYEN